MSVKYTKDTMTMVKELGGEEITIVPGTVGKIVADASPDEEWAWAVESLKQCYDHGLKEGVRLAIEPLNRFETYFLNRHDQALLLAKAVGPDCGICLDLFHMNIEERDMLQALRNAKGRLNDVHVADNNRMACGMGAIDWKAVIDTLKEVGYTGALTVEFVAPLDRTPANPYTNMLEQGNVEMTPEERKFMVDHGTGDLSDEFYTWLVDETVKTLRKHM
jgi:sugar phosphate isomerase/epimerase